MREIRLNGNWPLILPDHRADRPEWTSEAGWERERLDSMHANIQKGDVVIDCGSEEGDLPALWASWGAEVVLVEPNPVVWSCIRATFEANDLKPKSWFVGFASSQTDLLPDGLDFVQGVSSDGWPLCAHGEMIPGHGFRHLAQQANVTPQVRLDDLCELIDVSPDVITIDVEGSEWHVLHGAQRILREDKPLVYCSVHPEFLQDLYGQSPADVDALMGAFGYEKRHLATDHEVHVAFWHPLGRALK